MLAGRMPYGDFVLLHPPGILVVLAPFAELGALTSDQIGLAGARVGFWVLGAVNAALVARVGAREGLPGAAGARGGGGGAGGGRPGGGGGGRASRSFLPRNLLRAHGAARTPWQHGT